MVFSQNDEMASKLPMFGCLEFDYVSTAVAHRMVPTFPISADDFDALKGAKHRVQFVQLSLSASRACLGCLGCRVYFVNTFVVLSYGHSREGCNALL